MNLQSIHTFDTDTKLTNMEDLKNKLELIVKTRLTDNKISPALAIDAMMEFYGQSETQISDKISDNDMLLFQYGSYDWDGPGKKFELDFTRQIADQENNEFYQIRLTLYYKPGEIGSIEDFNLWNIDKPTITDWITTIRDTEGFKRATKVTPLHYKIELTKT